MDIKTSRSHPIRVDFIVSEEFPILNRLGITFAPGKQQSDAQTGFWQRSLSVDLNAMRSDFGVDTLISLIEDRELFRLGIGDLAEGCSRAGIDLVRFPIPDFSVPDPSQLSAFINVVERVLSDLNSGKTVVVHCKGGLGRAGTVAACCIRAVSECTIDETKAIEMVRIARGPGAIENQIQEDFVSHFCSNWGKRLDDVEFEIAPESETDCLTTGDGPHTQDSSRTHYLLFWQERSVSEHASNGLPLDVIASNELAMVMPDDVIWIVTLSTDRELFLAGRMRVGEIIDYDEAMRRMPNSGLWQAEYYALPAEGTEEYLSPIALESVIDRIRFNDDQNDHFATDEGRLNPQQLRGIRRLAPETTELITEIWETREVEIPDEQLLVLLKNAVEQDPNDVNSWQELAECHCRLGELEDAIHAYQQVLRIEPDNKEAMYGLGDAYFENEQFDEAKEHFEKLIDHYPEDAVGYIRLGLIFGSLGDPAALIDITRIGLRYDPRNPVAHFNIAQAYYELENYEYSLDWLGRTRELEDVNVSVANYLSGKCLRRLGRFSDERAAYLAVLEVQSDFIDAHFALGTNWARQHGGELGSTVPYFESGGDFEIQNPFQSFLFAMGSLALGHIDDARSAADDLEAKGEALATELHEFIEIAEHQEWPDQVELELIAVDTVPTPSTESSPARTRGPRTDIQFNVGDQEMVAKHLPDLYHQVLKMLVDGGHVDRLELPVASGPRRYLLSRKPQHKDGSEFMAAVEYGGYYMEAHNSRQQGIALLEWILEKVDLKGHGVTSRSEQSTDVQPSSLSLHDRVLGSMLGLAACDALGTTAEFKPTGSFPEITAMIGGGPFGLKPGEWTDDTSMALCLADSLIESNGFDATDQMERYLRWKNEGYLSSNGQAFDIGTTIRAALNKYSSQTGERNPFCGSVSPSHAGNGSLMRLAPVAIYFSDDPRTAIEWAAESSRTTHGARECIDACRYYAGLIIGALQGRSKDEILSPSFSPVSGLWQAEPLSDRIAEVANGAFKGKKAPEISSTGQGYVVLSLHAALWAFHHTRSFKDGALKVVNLGYDSDTYGAIYGQLAGAFYGSGSIPTEWIEKLAESELIEQLATGLNNQDPANNE